MNNPWEVGSAVIIRAEKILKRINPSYVNNIADQYIIAMQFGKWYAYEQFFLRGSLRDKRLKQY